MAFQKSLDYIAVKNLHKIIVILKENDSQFRNSNVGNNITFQLLLEQHK